MPRTQRKYFYQLQLYLILIVLSKSSFTSSTGSPWAISENVTSIWLSSAGSPWAIPENVTSVWLQDGASQCLCYVLLAERRQNRGAPVSVDWIGGYARVIRQLVILKAVVEISDRRLVQWWLRENLINQKRENLLFIWWRNRPFNRWIEPRI
jgi:hypothetical protein